MNPLARAIVTQVGSLLALGVFIVAATEAANWAYICHAMRKDRNAQA